MSFFAEKMAWGHTLPQTQKLVLLWLAWKADDRNSCSPTVKEIAVQTGLSDRCVQYQLANLEKKGLVVRTYRWDMVGRCAPTVYTLDLAPKILIGRAAVA
jgi:DNA-binding MarR family transcriptional regulator